MSKVTVKHNRAYVYDHGRLLSWDLTPHPEPTIVPSGVEAPSDVLSTVQTTQALIDRLQSVNATNEVLLRRLSTMSALLSEVYGYGETISLPQGLRTRIDQALENKS